MVKNKVWEEAKTISVKRGNKGYPVAELDAGVKFFVLMIEKFGGKTLFSCEGHPYGFYIVFQGLPPEILQQIIEIGEFIVEKTVMLDVSLADRLSLERQELCCLRDKEVWTEELKADYLTYIADAWNTRLGPLEIKEHNKVANQPISVPLPYLENKTISIIVDDIVDLDLLARERLGISETTQMSSIEILNQANFENILAIEDWEVDLVNWPIRRAESTDYDEINIVSNSTVLDSELMFTHSELLDWLESWEKGQR